MLLWHTNSTFIIFLYLHLSLFIYYHYEFKNVDSKATQDLSAYEKAGALHSTFIVNRSTPAKIYVLISFSVFKYAVGNSDIQPCLSYRNGSGAKPDFYVGNTICAFTHVIIVTITALMIPPRYGFFVFL